jgi:hypothetical protein
MVSAFSSLFLQMRSRYLISSTRTSFHILMALLHEQDRCTWARDRRMYQLETGRLFKDTRMVATNLVVCGN